MLQSDVLAFLVGATVAVLFVVATRCFEEAKWLSLLGIGLIVAFALSPLSDALGTPTTMGVLVGGVAALAIPFLLSYYRARYGNSPRP